MQDETISILLACLTQLRIAENQYREGLHEVHSKLMDLAVIMDDVQFRLLLEYLKVPSKIKLDVWRIIHTKDFERVRAAKQSPIVVKKAV